MLGKTTSTWITDRRATARRKILDAAWTVAREQGVAALTLREVADRVGIRAPSLYSHFDSKHAIYDAMFGESWQELLDVNRAAELPKSPRAALRAMTRRAARGDFGSSAARLTSRSSCQDSPNIAS